jgi:hypothetical protein
MGGIKLDANSDTINANLLSPCTNCTVLKAIANLAYKDGTPADVGSGVYTHHIIMTQVRYSKDKSTGGASDFVSNDSEHRLAGDN